MIGCPKTYIPETNHEVAKCFATKATKQPNNRTTNPTNKQNLKTAKMESTAAASASAAAASVFTYITKDYRRNGSTTVKLLLFVKLDDDKVFVKASSPGKGMWIDIVMSYDQLMTHKYLKAYYELSLKAIGKPSLDTQYGVLGVKEADAIDAMYIVEDILTKEKVAIKGESYHSPPYTCYSRESRESYEDLSDEEDVAVATTEVATDAELAEFNATYDVKFDESNFDERIAIYTALVDEL